MFYINFFFCNTMCPSELQIQIFISESCVLLCLNIFSGSFGSDLFHSQWIYVKIKWVNISKSLGRGWNLLQSKILLKGGGAGGGFRNTSVTPPMSISVSLIIFQSSYLLLFEWVPLACPLSLIVLYSYFSYLTWLSSPHLYLSLHFFLDNYEHTFHLFIWVYNL